MSNSKLQQSQIPVKSISQMWSLVNGGSLSIDQTAHAHDVIRQMFMTQQQAAIEKLNCSLVSAGTSSKNGKDGECIGAHSVLASDFIRSKEQGMISLDEVNTINSTRSNQRQQDRFLDTAGMLGDAARARPCEIDTPYQK